MCRPLPQATSSTGAPAVLADSDGDGIPDAFEEDHPNKTAEGRADGNRDGIPDAQQPHVANVRSPIDGGIAE